MKSPIEPRHPSFFFAEGRAVMAAFGDTSQERAGAGLYARADSPHAAARIAAGLNLLEEKEHPRPASLAEALG